MDALWPLAAAVSGLLVAVAATIAITMLGRQIASYRSRNQAQIMARLGASASQASAALRELGEKLNEMRDPAWEIRVALSEIGFTADACQWWPVRSLTHEQRPYDQQKETP